MAMVNANLSVPCFVVFCCPNAALDGKVQGSIARSPLFAVTPGTQTISRAGT
jgi:hypothetical protein